MRKTAVYQPPRHNKLKTTYMLNKTDSSKNLHHRLVRYQPDEGTI